MSNNKPYVECPYCGAHNDHGEACDCREEEGDGDAGTNTGIR